MFDWLRALCLASSRLTSLGPLLLLLPGVLSASDRGRPFDELAAAAVVGVVAAGVVDDRGVVSMTSPLSGLIAG